MSRTPGETRGRKTDEARRRQIAHYRARGWTFAQIGRHFGVTRQCVQTLYRLSGEYEGMSGICCCECRREISPWNARRCGGMMAAQPVFCLDCLAGHPEAGMGERLKAFRVHISLTQAELAGKLGLHCDSIGRIERGEVDPNRSTIAKLMQIFGIALVAPLAHSKDANHFSALSSGTQIQHANSLRMQVGPCGLLALSNEGGFGLARGCAPG